MLKPEDIVVDIANYPTRGMLLGIPVGVKITHKPTGIFVVEDSERSQHRNREVALQKLEKMVAEAKPAPMSDDNRKVAYAAADKLRKLGYSWDDGIGGWVKTDESASPTAGMNLAQRIIHVGGRNNASGYVEFGSIQAVEALVKQVLRDQPAGEAAPQPPAAAQEPIDMVLHCPKCGLQHIDASEPPVEFEPGAAQWSNPPHRSHLCHGCGHIWRPADVPTNGVKAVKTKGKADSPIATPQPAVTAEAVDALPDEKTCVDYVLRYGGRCRDCADENGVCPGSGLPCGGQRKAVTHVVQALRYGLQHGYLRAAQLGGA